MTVCYHSTQHLRIHQSDFVTCLPLNRTHLWKGSPLLLLATCLPRQCLVCAQCRGYRFAGDTFDPDCHSHASATHLSRVRESSVYSGRSFKSLGEAESWCG